MKIELPPHLGESRRGAYLVGGSVRDLIRGIAPWDYDIAVATDPGGWAQQMAERIGGRVVRLGKKRFTVYRVVSLEGCLDITPFKGRDISQDLLARDFTINALACDLTDGRVMDVAGGLADLHNGTVRAVSPSIFKKDPVRLVRAYRMAAKLGFRIDAETVRLIVQYAYLVGGTAGERIWSELMQIMACPNIYPIFVQMADTQVLFNIIPELLPLKQSQKNHPHMAEGFDHTLKAVQALEVMLQEPGVFLPPEAAGFFEKIDSRTRALLKFSILLYAIGQPSCRCKDSDGQVLFLGHAANGAELVQTIGRRLRMSNRQREWVAALNRLHQHPLGLYLAQQYDHPGPSRTIGRFFRQCGELTPFLILLTLAGIQAQRDGHLPSQDLDITRFFADTLASYFEKNLHKGLPPILTGQDMIQLFKIEPSPLIGTLLRRVRELQLSGVITHREEAIQWVADYMNPAKKRAPCRQPAGGTKRNPERKTT